MNRAQEHTPEAVSSSHRWAFTIIELLIVIAIIILLLGLLMPALSKARREATDIICQSYLRSLSVAGDLYLEDNEGFFPAEPNEWLYATKSISEAHPIGCRWHDRQMALDSQIMTAHPEYRGLMWDYISGGNLRICPTFRRFASSKGCENQDHNQDIEIQPQNSYSINGYLGTNHQGGVLKVSEIRDPSKFFFFGEENSWSIQTIETKFKKEVLCAPLSTSALDDTVLLILPTPQAGNCFATYHRAPDDDLNRGFSHLVFIDGHAGRISFADQLRKTMHGGKSRLGPAGNLSLAWADESEPPRGWDEQ